MKRYQNFVDFKKHKAYYTDLNKFVDEIYDRAYALGWTWSELANRSGIGKMTVYRLGDGTTRYPRLLTVMKLAEVVGMRFRL